MSRIQSSPPPTLPIGRILASLALALSLTMGSARAADGFEYLEAFDWTTSCTPVTNQGYIESNGQFTPRTGTDWLHAAIGEIEAKEVIARTHPATSNIYSIKDAGNYYPQTAWDPPSGGGTGGNGFMVASYLAAYGSVDRTLEPWTITRQTWNPDHPRLRNVRNWVYLGDLTDDDLISDDIITIKRALQHGPVSTAISTEALDAWTVWWRNLVVPDTIAVAPENAKHSVLIVGWDDNKEQSYGASRGAWKVRLSYGPSWLSSTTPGYCWIGYTAAGIGSGASYYPPDGLRTALTSATALMNDSGWSGDALGFTGRRDVHMLNKYTAPALDPAIHWILNAVDIAAVEPDLSYEIRLYSDFNGSEPVGAPLATQTGTLTDAGYFAIELDDPLTVTSGSSVCIWTRLVTEGADAMVVPVSDLRWPSPDGAARSYYSATGANGTWLDMHANGQRQVVLRGRIQIAPPNDPTTVTATNVQTDRIRWNWSDNSADETGFKVYAAAGTTEPVNLSDTLAADTTAWDHTGLEANTEYAFQVAAFSANGDSDRSDLLTTYTAIEPLSGLEFFNIDPNVISVRGANTPSNLGAGASGLIFANESTTESSTVLTHNNGWSGGLLLDANTSYTFRGFSVNGAGIATPPVSDVAFTHAYRPLAPVVTTPTLTTLQVAIGAGDGNPAYTQYAIKIALVGGPVTDSWIQADGSIGATEAWRTAAEWSTTIVTGLLAGKTFAFGVKARNNATPPVETQFSLGASGTTVSPMPPSAPYNANATLIADSSIRWTWQDDNLYETGFKIFAGPGTTAPLAVAATAPLDTFFYDHTGLSPNSPYAFQVATVNAVGDSAKTANLSVYSGIEPAVGLAFTIVTDDTIAYNLPNAPSNLAVGQSGILFSNDTAGTDSGWVQTNDLWYSTGLTPNTYYTFTARTRNADALETSPYSFGRYTLALAPAAPAVGTITASTIAIAVGPGDGNSATTEYAIRILPSVNGRFWVQPNGTVGPSAVYRTAADWDTVTVMGLAHDTVYDFFAKARNGDYLETAFGPNAQARTLKVAPEAPVVRPATRVRADSLRWNWYDQSEIETHFNLYYGPGATAPLARTTTVTADSTYFDYTGLEVNREYAFQVSAANEGGESAKTPNQSIYTYCQVPNAVTLSNPLSFSLDVTLVPGDGNPTHSLYTIRISPPVNNMYWVQPDGNLGSSAAFQTLADWGTTTIRGLLPLTYYTVQARARNGNNVLTDYSLAAQMRTLVSPPATPSNVGTLSITATSIAWAWQDNADNEIGFNVYSGQGLTPPATVTQSPGANATFWFSPTALQPDTQYVFQIAAYNIAGESPKTTPVARYTLANTPLAPILSNATPNSLDLTVVGGDGNPATTPYAIRVSPGVEGKFWLQADGSFGDFAVWQTRAAWGTVTTREMDASTPYTFRIKARNGEEVETNFGAGGVGTTLAAPPPVAPSNPGFGDVSLSSLRWNWTDNAIYETGFKVYAAAGAVAPAEPIHTTSKNVTFWYHTDLSSNTQYTMQVAATNATADSAKTAAVSAYTAIEPVTDLTFTSVSATAMAVGAGNTLSNLGAGSSGVLYGNRTQGTVAPAWSQSASPWISGGLSPNTPYTFRGQSRNGDGMTTVEYLEEKYTLANAPVAVRITTHTASTADVAIDPSDGNTTATLYGITITHPFFGDFEVQTDGSLGAEPAFQLATDWSTFTVTGLYGNTTYTLRATARNGEGIDSEPGAVATVVTEMGRTGVDDLWILFE